MSAPPRKSGSPSKSSDSSSGSPRSHSRSTSSNTNGLTRSPSTRSSTPVSARAAARKPGRSNLSMSNIPKISGDQSSEEARAQNAILIEELREQLQKAETASEQYRKQLGVLQMRLDEAVSEQGRLEDQNQEKDGRIETLNSEIREHVRQLRDLEQTHEVERNTILLEREAHASREEEMQAAIQRLRDSLSQRDKVNSENDRNNICRSPSFRNRPSPDIDGQFAPSSQLERSPSRNNSQILLQKDKLIESLRLELAESQIKQVELENKGGGRQRELEKELLEARMANARLMEDNESYQLLLSERTLNGDFARGDFMRDANPESETEIKSSANGPGSLADELRSADVHNETEDMRRLETEIKSLKDQNKALTLYIERIISRVLQHEGFEAVLDKSENDPPSAAKSEVKSFEKDLPLTQTERDDSSSLTFLQKARSVVSGQSVQQQSKAVSSNATSPPASVFSNAHENPDTAPRVPLYRAPSMRSGHRRTRSEMADIGKINVVGQIYPSRNSGGPSSPSLMGPGSRQSALSSTSYFSGGLGTGSGALSQTSQQRSRLSSSASVVSDPYGETSSAGATSPPRSNNGMNNYTGAVMTQSKLRPLRLVSEASKTAEEEETARKKVNRGSWMSWFNRPPTSDPSQGQSPQD